MTGLLTNPTVIRTICIIALLIVLPLSFRLCNFEPLGLIKGLYTAALKELSGNGGPAAQANLVLCAFGCVVTVFICFTKHLFRALAFLDNAADRETSESILVVVLFFFFIWSVRFIQSKDEHNRVSKR